MKTTRLLAAALIACLLGLALPMKARAAGLEQVQFLMEELPPYNYQVDGKYRGVSYEVLEAALKAVDIEMGQCTIKMYPWARIYDMIQHDSNTCAFTMRRTPEREALFKWAGPIVDFRLAMIFKKTRVTIDKPSDIANYVVGIMKLNNFKNMLLGMGVKEENIVVSSTPEKTTTLLKHDRTDILVGDERATYHALNQIGVSSDELASYYLSEKDYGYFAFNKTVPDTIVARLQKGLDAIKSSGQLDEILQKYNVHQ